MHATDNVMAAIRSELVSNAPTELATCTFNLRDEADVKTYPLVVITDTDTDEHDVLRGVYLVGVDVALRTIPEDTSNSNHELIAQQIWDILADEATVTVLDNWDADMDVWDIRCQGALANEDDEYKQSVISLEVRVSHSP